MDIYDLGQISLNDFSKKVVSLSPEQITALTIEIRSGSDWKEKTRAIINSLEECDKLEAFGKGLNSDQCLEVFSYLPNAIKKLTPILVGLPHEVFHEVVLRGNESQLQALKQQGMAEPMQHQLTVYQHQIQQRLEILNKTYELIDNKIQKINPETLKLEAIQELWRELCLLSELYQELMRETSIILLLAWNTDRTDLIELLTNAKEQCHRISRFGVGFPATDKDPASGLFANLDNRVFSVFGNSNDIAGVRDNEPAIEGLTRFSAWYLHDYWKMGLLPEIKDAAELDQKDSSIREKLFRDVQLNLAKLGLHTVKDLKNAWIYSQKTFEHFIKSKALL